MSETIRHFEVAWETGSRRLSKCIVGLFWGTNLTPRWKCVPQNGPTMHVTTISTRSPAQPQNGELLQLYFFLPPWWQEVHIFPTLTPVAQVAITVCIFPRKRAPVASFTALNNLPFHHRSPATEPCYKFPCASNRLHIAHGTGTRFLFRALLLSCPWGQRSIKNDLERTELPEGFAYPTSPPPPPSPLLWYRFLREGDGSFQVVWRTDLEVDLTRTQNYCVELLALYLRQMIIDIQYSDEVVTQRRSCRNNALPQSPREKLWLVAISPLVWTAFPSNTRRGYIIWRSPRQIETKSLGYCQLLHLAVRSEN